MAAEVFYLVNMRSGDIVQKKKGSYEHFIEKGYGGMFPYFKNGIFQDTGVRYLTARNYNYCWSDCHSLENVFRRITFEKTDVIHDPAVRDFVRECLTMAPSYFWTAPASSSGKHHPTFAVGEGGLVRHTLAAVAVAGELFPAYPELERDRDEILAALFLHDTLKYGREDSGYTAEDHPLLPLMYYYPKVSLIGEDAYRRIMAFIRTHMGIWGPRKPAEECGYRISPAEFVHLCDYIASRRGLEQIFKGGVAKWTDITQG